MERTLKLTGENWSYGSYIRNTYRRDIVYTVIQYKEMDALYNLNLGRMNVRDGFVEQMLCDGLITQKIKKNYEDCVMEVFDPLTRFDDSYIEDLYGALHQERINCFGASLFEKEQYLMTQRRMEFDLSDGIDQTKKKDELISSSQSVIFCLSEPSFFFLMKKDIEIALSQNKNAYILSGSKRGDTVPSRTFMEKLFESNEKIQYLSMKCRNGCINLEGIQWNEELQNQIYNGNTFLIVYGEDGLLTCKDMLIDSIVYGIPTGYFTRNVTNQHHVKKPCVVYVPKEFNVIRHVGVWSRTRISYLQLARLWEAYGDIIYSLTPDELYLKYPQFFLNIYAVGSKYEEAEPNFPLKFEWEKYDSEHAVMRQFDRQKDEIIQSYLNEFDHIEYTSAYYDENLQRIEIPWFYEERQSGILVHAIRVGNVKDSQVMDCNGVTVREMMKQEKREGYPLRFLSNFLFFLTPRLAQLYNVLRKERPREQISFQKGHLDYKLLLKDGKRMESFPLFEKSCIGMKDNGQYVFFHYRLNGGTVEINGKKLYWNNTDVNTEKPQGIAVYTPFYAKEVMDTAAKQYTLAVGEGRINIVMIQNEIICIRRGPVLLSSLGVVISMDEKIGNAFLEEIDARPLEDDYYECDDYEVNVILDKPEELSEEEWKQMKWVYGGGMSLILDGKGLCDDGEEAMLQWLSKEGWMSVMSRQTQESSIHEMVRHPRTAIGITKDGNLVILVYSGRTDLSVGADYNEMIQIARNLFPDIQRMMNVDGGGSSVLGMVLGNSFMELSYPATSANNCSGMVRPINTIFYLEP